MAKRKKILFICSFYPSKSHPHHGIFFREHAQALTSAFDVSVLCVRTPSFMQTRRFGKTISIENVAGVREMNLVESSLSHRIPFFERRTWTRSALAFLEKEWRENESQPDVVVAQTALPPGLLALELKHKFDIPFVVYEHFSFLSTMFLMQAEEMTNVYEKAEKILAVSNALRAVILEHQSNGKDVHILPNVLLPAADPVPTAPLPFLEKKEFKWLFVGRNEPVKAPDLLREIIQKAPAHWTFTVVGDGFPDDESWMNLSLNNKKLWILGPLEKSQLLAKYGKHQALLSTSQTETFGLSLAEMIASGRPVVCTPSGGPESFVDATNGAIAESHSAEDVLKAMKHVEQHYSAYDASSMSKNILKRFGKQAFLDKFTTFVGSISP